MIYVIIIGNLSPLDEENLLFTAVEYAPYCNCLSHLISSDSIIFYLFITASTFNMRIHVTFAAALNLRWYTIYVYESIYTSTMNPMNLNTEYENCLCVQFLELLEINKQYIESAWL